MKTIYIIVTALAGATLVGGCASSTSGGAYSRAQTRGEQAVRLGIVESVRPVQIEGTKTPIGPVAGAAIGGIGANQIGGGSGRAIATILGVVAGGLAGAATEEGTTRRPGVEVMVRLESGNLIAVTQEADEQFQVGERVKVLSGGGTTRVSRY